MRTQDKKVNILIVINDTIFSIYIEGLLKEKGYNISKIVKSPEEAIKSVKKINPDIILIDIGYRDDINMIQTANKIRTLADIPIIFFITYICEEMHKALETSPNYRYLMKPVTEEDLYDIVEDFLINRGNNKI